MGVFDRFHSDVKGEESEVYSENGGVEQQGIVSENSDDLQRRLGNRQIQLLAIGMS
jgi:amino acid transporter